MIRELTLVLNKMNDIKYGYVDNDKNIYPDSLEDWSINFNKLYRLQSPDELLRNKYGVCWDQVELERLFLEKKSIPSKSYFIIAHDKKQEPTHTFIVVHKDKYYWLEHSWQPYRGIHEYNTLLELLKDVKNKFKTSIEKEKVKNYELSIYQYEKPNFNISCVEFMNHCEKGKKINI